MYLSYESSVSMVETHKQRTIIDGGGLYIMEKNHRNP